MSIQKDAAWDAALDISLRKIDHFLAAVECGSITQAADKRYTTQATVSRSIQSLEKELGFSLAYREQKGIKPTEAGAFLFENWSHSLKQLIDGFDKAQRIALPETASICVADSVDIHNINKSRYLMPTIERFEKKNPDIRVKIHEIEALSPHVLKTEGVDLAFVQDCDLKWISGNYCHELITTQRIVMLMSAKNHLAKREQVTLSDTVDEVLLLGHKPLLSGASEQIMSLFFERGLAPQNVEFCQTLIELKMQLLQNKGITIVSELFPLCDDPQMQVFPIDDERAETHLIWLSDNENALTREFLSCAREIKKQTARKAS